MLLEMIVFVLVVSLELSQGILYLIHSYTDFLGETMIAKKSMSDIEGL